MELYNLSEMQSADKLAIKSGISGIFLMEQAGSRVASHVERLCNGPCRVCILAGPGNNGGDAFVIARLLRQRAYKIDMHLLCTKRGQIEDDKTDAQFMKKKWEKNGGITHQLITKTDFKSKISSYDLIIDGLFGAGLSRDIQEPLAAIIEEINHSKTPVLAIDVPSGLNGDSGQIMGTAIKATYTSSFYRPKQGHYLYPGREICGELYIDNIGIPERVNEELSVNQHINTPEQWSSIGRSKQQNSHKYNHGSVMVVSGAKTMRGAAVLSSNAAMRAGAGLVTIAEAKDDLEVHPRSFAAIMQIEVPKTDSQEEWAKVQKQKKVSATLIGPGCLPNEETKNRVLSLIECSERIILDAGAITAFAGVKKKLANALNKRSEKEPISVLTPHEGEFKKLFPEVDMANKVDAAREAAKQLNAIIVLKGPDTVIAAPQGKVLVNINAPSSLATAGSGDVLAGIIVSLASNQELPLYEAAAAAVYIHSECANRIGTELIADDLIDHIAAVKANYFAK